MEAGFVDDCLEEEEYYNWFKNKSHFSSVSSSSSLKIWNNYLLGIVKFQFNTKARLLGKIERKNSHLR